MRIYFDENFSPHLANGFRVFQDGRPSENIDVFHVVAEFGKGSPDEEWIPEVAKKHGCIVSQDYDIYRLRRQRELCRDHKVGIFFFRQPKKKTYTYWQWIYEVFGRWDHIKDTAKDKPRPFSYAYMPNKNKPVDMELEKEL